MVWVRKKSYEDAIFRFSVGDIISRKSFLRDYSTITTSAMT